MGRVVDLKQNPGLPEKRLSRVFWWSENFVFPVYLWVENVVFPVFWPSPCAHEKIEIACAARSQGSQLKNESNSLTLTTSAAVFY